MEKYFSTHRQYFIMVATATTSVGAASLKEKEMAARYFRHFITNQKETQMPPIIKR